MLSGLLKKETLNFQKDSIKLKKAKPYNCTFFKLNKMSNFRGKVMNRKMADVIMEKGWHR